MLISQPKIFVSSTIFDLPNERAAAKKAIENCGGVPVMSEFTIEAQSLDSVSVCLDKVKNSDIYILIVGGKYGWQPYGNESITELEYKEALKNNISILVFNTTYNKEDLQENFLSSVEKDFFRKTVSDAFELKSEIEKSLKTEITKKQEEFFYKTEPVYSNIVRINFPDKVYRADLDIDKKEVKELLKEKGIKLKRKPSLFDYAVGALRAKEIKFPGDWIIWNKGILSFHDLTDDQLPLTEIIDRGTAETLTPDEVYEQSKEDMSVFKFLLKKCLETKLHKLGVKWIKEEGMFAFIPVSKDREGRWESRKVSWSKKKKASRTVVDVKRNLKNPEEVFNMKCLGFRVRFEFIDNEWYLAIKPDWVFLWSDFKVSDLAYKNIQWLKKNEKNIHVFNHYNFILHYIQPKDFHVLFEEHKDYKFLSIGKIEKFDFAPIIPDDTWRNLESAAMKKKLNDDSGNVDLFS